MVVTARGKERKDSHRGYGGSLKSASNVLFL